MHNFRFTDFFRGNINKKKVTDQNIILKKMFFPYVFRKQLFPQINKINIIGKQTSNNIHTKADPGYHCKIATRFNVRQYYF